MAGPRKRRTIEEKSDSENESANEQMEQGGSLQVDFEGRNPDPEDFHGIQTLLKQLFLKSHVNISQLCDMLISQQGIGSVLKQSMDEGDDEDMSDDGNSNDVFGITSVANLSSNKDTECVKQLFEILKEHSKKHAEKSIDEKISQILSDNNKRIGLLINERFINIPAKIADPLMDSLLGEIDRMASKNQSYKFDYFVMICKMHRQMSKDKKDEGTFFVNAEEEMFYNASETNFEFSVASESDTGVDGLWTEDDKQMIPLRRILIIPAQKFANIVSSVKTFVA